MFRVLMIGLPIVYLLGVFAMAAVYMTTYSEAPLGAAVMHGARWPLSFLRVSGLF